MPGYSYILASQKNGTLYTGVTTDLAQRIDQHRNSLTPGFTSRYSVFRLVWYQEFFDVRDAIAKEKAIKGWKRQWKIDLIEKTNPDWNDLFKGWGW